MLKVLLFLACINFFYINSYALLKPDSSLRDGENTFRHKKAGTVITAGRESSLPVHFSNRFNSPDQGKDSIQWNGMENSSEYADEYRGYRQDHPVISGTRHSRRRGYTSRKVRTSQQDTTRRNSGNKTYRVKRGDTLFSIARKFHVSVNTIRRTNNIRQGSTLYSGQRLRIPSQEKSRIARTAGSSRTQRRPRFSWPLTSILTIRRDSLDGVRPIGIIITGRPGANVQCSAMGTVKKIGMMRGYGRYVIVKHGTSYLTVYANLAQISVQEGQRVPRGRTIGRINHRDHSLHFQINKGGKAKNPLSLLPERS